MLENCAGGKKQTNINVSWFQLEKNVRDLVVFSAMSGVKIINDWSFWESSNEMIFKLAKDFLLCCVISKITEKSIQKDFF